MEIAKLSSKGQLTVPIAIREFLKINQGDKVVFLIEDGKVQIYNASALAINQGGAYKRE